jgi:UDP:flavonoid glycosyltransferase YjiC (YdhE family)
MALILFLPYAHQLGTTFGLIELANIFSKLGDDVVFAGEGPYIKLAKSSGFKVVKLIEIPFTKYRKVVDSGNINFHDEKSLNLHVKEEIALLKELKPNLVITQARTSTIIGCRMLNIPFISLTVSFLTEYYDLPYEIPETFSLFPLTKIPMVGKIMNNNAKRFVVSKAKNAAKAYNQILKKYRLPPIKSMYDAYSGEFLTLIPESRLLFPINNFAPKDKYIFTGPLQNRTDIHPVPDWISRAKEKDGKFIYLSMGSSSDKLYPYMLRRISSIFSQKDNYYIITNSCNLLKKELPLPKNVFLTNTAPARLMMQLADITICHGGKGTIYDSLLNKVPILGIPQQAEQELNLRRIKALGLGDYILSTRVRALSDQELFLKIDNLINNKLVKRNLEYYSAEIFKEMEDLNNIIENIHNKINE